MNRYRSENFSGSMVRGIYEVMRFEIFELGNTDILEHIMQYFVHIPDVIDRLRNVIEELQNNGYVDDFPEQDQTVFLSDLVSELNSELGANIRYALWLADKATVIEQYGTEIDEYEVGSVVLSDLGYDGTLYGYEECPEPINTNLAQGDEV